VGGERKKEEKSKEKRKKTWPLTLITSPHPPLEIGRAFPQETKDVIDV